MYLVTLADVHAGSTCGLLPPGFVNHEDNEINQNATQRWLWKCWEDFNKFVMDVTDGDFMLLLNGDLIEGIHHRTTQVISSEVADHVKAAKMLLSPLCDRASKVFFVRGTECHVGDRENSIARELGGVKNPDAKDRHTFDRFVLDINGVRIVARHHISTSIRPWLEATALGADLASEQLEAARNGEKIPQILLAAHRHRFGMFQDASGMAIVSPPWQHLTRHGYKVVPSARTKPGGFILDFKGVGHGMMPRVHHREYISQTQTPIKA